MSLSRNSKPYPTIESRCDSSDAAKFPLYLLCINTRKFFLAASFVSSKENLGGVGCRGRICMMAQMMSIRLDGQMSLLAKCNEDGWVDSGVGMGEIWSDCCANSGCCCLPLVCGLYIHLRLITCHSVVDFLVIEADDSCPEAGDFQCHSVVDLGFIGASPDAYY